MKILRNSDNKSIILNIENQFNTDLGREESLELFEDEILNRLINPIENHETVRYEFKPYSGLTQETSELQSNIWYYFYFYNEAATPTHLGGLNYKYVGITPNENSNLTTAVSKCFFRLEFYKIPESQEPNRTNRKLAFSRNISFISGEEVIYTTYKRNIHLPVFVGSRFKNKENMYFYWFQDLTIFDNPIFTGNTFYMTAKFYNAKDGSIINFGNNRTEDKTRTDSIIESTDLYYKVVINPEDRTYQIFDDEGNPIGFFDNPVNFYEIP